MSAPPSHVPEGAPRGGEFEIVTTAPGRLAARGTLTFSTAKRARTEGLLALRTASGSDLEIDCSAVSPADSAGLAVLLDWLAVSKRYRRRLRYTGLPASLLAIGRISGVAELLQTGV